jgi:hypothetical protein
MSISIKKQLFAMAFGLIVLASGMTACSTNKSETNAVQTSNSNRVATTGNGQESANAEISQLTKERENLEQERQRLAKEKANLEKEKKQVADTKNATPPDVDTEIWNGDIWQVHNPPSNVRVSPDGKILCTISKKTKINLRGTSNIKDKNGEWLYTDVCGKIGFIHSSQIQMEDGVPAG